jgi:photosystem I subunit PsaO
VAVAGVSRGRADARAFPLSAARRSTVARPAARRSVVVKACVLDVWDGGSAWSGPRRRAGGRGDRASASRFRPRRRGRASSALLPRRTHPRRHERAPRRALRAHDAPLLPHSSSSNYKWITLDPLAFGLGFLGWTVPASSPSPSFGGGSLFGELTGEISKGLSNFPTPPAMDSQFWLLLVLYHVGLFVTMTLAQIGIQARKQEGYL